MIDSVVRPSSAVSLLDPSATGLQRGSASYCHGWQSLQRLFVLGLVLLSPARWDLWGPGCRAQLVKRAKAWLSLGSMLAQARGRR